MRQLTRSLILFLSLILTQARASHVVYQGNDVGKEVGKIVPIAKGAVQTSRSLAAAGMLALEDLKLLKNSKDLLTIPYAEVRKSTSILERFGLGGIQGINRIYSARELIRRAAEPGPFHNFPEHFNNIIFENGTKTITYNYFKVAKPGLSDTNILYKYPGTINGIPGFFEIGVRPSLSGSTEVIMHRFFNPKR
jgi:hypothetical protein